MCPPSPTTRTRLSVPERRAQLLRLGVQLFSATPYDAISIDEIAQAAGISKGLLYHYFGSKRDFYLEVVREAVDELLSLTAPDPELPADEQLVRGLHAYLDYVRRRREGYLTVMQGGMGADPEVRALVDRMRQRVVQRLLDGLGIDDPSPRLLVGLRGWIGALEGLVLAWLETTQVDDDEVVTLGIATFEAMMLTQESPAG